jgi:hypothetical protein
MVYARGSWHERQFIRARTPVQNGETAARRADPAHDAAIVAVRFSR